MLFTLAKRILGHSEVKQILQALNEQVTELRRKPEGTGSSFFFFALCLILACDHLMQIRSELFLLLNKFFLFFSSHVFPG